MKRWLLLLCLSVLSATQIACVFHSDRMHPASSDVAPDPTVAKIVFLRPSSMGGAVIVTILDHNGRFLGESEAHSHFTARVPPGEYVFVSWSESTPAMRASLAPGRVYFVKVDPQFGVGSARVQLLNASPRTEHWAEVQGWLAETEPIAADEAAGQAYVRTRSEDARERIAAAQKHLTEYDARDLAERTIRPEDGVAQPLVVGAPTPPMGVPVPIATPIAVPMPVAPAPVAPVAARPAAPARPSGDDIVFLKNGGRVRGTVMEEEPKGVSVKLLDGTTRLVPRAEVDRVDYGGK